MKVLKFGGTSLGSSSRMKAIIPLITLEKQVIVVLSAISGTTDILVEIINLLNQSRKTEAKKKICELEDFYKHTAGELFDSQVYIDTGKKLIEDHFQYIRGFTQKIFTKIQEKAILAQGELITSALFHQMLKEQGINSGLLSALSFMRIDKEGEPDNFYIKENLNRELKEYKTNQVIITQGYICRNAYGAVDNLKRGGSDYSASLIGAAIHSEEIQIWTDINGFQNNDPRYVTETRILRELSFNEVAELAYFGAKILHPNSIQPCKESNIPVRLKNSMNPDDPGTIITNKIKLNGIKAVAAKDNITAIKIKSARMLLAYGFLRKIFEVFEIYRTPIDMITTSEVTVSLTIDNTEHLEEIKKELEKFSTVEIVHDNSIICIVGNFIAEKNGVAVKILEAIREIPLRMISYGGSSHNISVLVKSDHKVKALNLLNKELFKITK
ncbi:MAG: aspartate kinase [Bacteroidetes bacterium]|nr:aspartate kinase [Bacteroidota bacterium]